MAGLKQGEMGAFLSEPLVEPSGPLGSIERHYLEF